MRENTLLIGGGLKGHALCAFLQAQATSVLNAVEQYEEASDIGMWQLLDAVPHPCLVLRPDTPHFTIAGANIAYLDATRTRQADIMGRGVFEVFPEDGDPRDMASVRRLRASLEQVIASRGPDRLTVQRYGIHRPDGVYQERYWNSTNVPLLGQSGAVKFVIHNVEDVTELVLSNERVAAAQAEMAEERDRANLLKAEILQQASAVAQANRDLEVASEALREREEDLQAFVDLNPQLPWVADPEGRILTLSQRWLDITGTTHVPASGSDCVDAFHPEDRAGVAMAWKNAVSRGMPFDAEARLRMAGGCYHWWRIRAFPAMTALAGLSGGMAPPRTSMTTRPQRWHSGWSRSGCA